MKVAVLVAVFLVCFVVKAWAADSYDSRYDAIDVDSVLSNDRVLTNYIKCLMDKAPCTKEGRSLKKDLPEALENSCAKCSETQKRNVRKAVNHIKDKRPADWAKLRAKYDPDNKYHDSFNKFLDGE